MNFEELSKIMKMFEASTIYSLEVEADGMKVRLSKGELAPTVAPVAQATSQPTKSSANEAVVDGTMVTCPLVGTFHNKPFPTAEPFVSVGDKVKKGQKLCIIEAMKVMNEITAPCDGVVKQIFFEDNQMVDYGANLMCIGEENV